MNSNSTSDDDGSIDDSATAQSGNAPSPNLTPDAAPGWQPRTRQLGRELHWHTRYKTALLIGAVLPAVVLVALMVRRGNSAPNTTAQSTTNATGMQAMAGMQPSADGVVTLTPTQIRQFGVTFGIAEQRTLTDDVRTAGIVTADETRLTSVTPRFGGYVERLYVNSMGQPVRKGQPLATVYSPDVLAAEQELLLARGLDRTLNTSTVPGVSGTPADLVGAARRRLDLWGVSSAQITDVLRTGRPSPTVTLYSPASGVVTELKVMQGQALQAGTSLYTITDLSQVWVDAEIREADAALVSVGASAKLTFTAYPGKQYVGRVGYVYPSVAAESRTLKARIVVTNANGLLKPGMFATVNLTAPTRSALTVPSSAVVHTGERSLIFVDIGGGRLAPRDVGVGGVSGDYTEILSGVEAGQRVATSAQFLIDSESNLGEVMRSMIGTGSGGNTGATSRGNGSRGSDSTQAMPGMSATSTPKPR